MSATPSYAVEEAVRAFQRGQMVVILDRPDRENEGDLAIAAEYATPAALGFMVMCGRGLVCMPTIGERLDELRLPLMVSHPEGGAPAFTVSVDARSVGTGISARDRAATVRAMLDPRTRREDLVRPGHLFPLRCAPGGLLERQGHTEASVELARIAGLYPAAVICEVLNPAGDAASPPELRNFARCHNLPLVTIADLAATVERPPIRPLRRQGPGVLMGA